MAGAGERSGGTPSLWMILAPVVRHTDELLGGGAAVHVDQMLTYAAVGTPREVGEYLGDFQRKTGADELIVVHQARGIEERLRSVTLAAEAVSA